MNSNKLKLDIKEWQEIGGKLRVIRENKNLTQEEAATEAKITTSYYARIERGEEEPRLAVLKAIFKVLKVKSSDILPF